MAAGPGVLLLADAEGAGAGRSRAIMAASDLSVPPLSTATGQYAAHASLRETVTELDMLIPGANISIIMPFPYVVVFTNMTAYFVLYKKLLKCKTLPRWCLLCTVYCVFTVYLVRRVVMDPTTWQYATHTSV